MTNVTVLEVTHHGDFYETRTIVVDPTSLASVANMLATCCYTYTPPEHRIARVAAELEREGKASHGWTRWEVVPDDVPPAERQVMTQGEHEFTLIAHVRGWCHNGDTCLLCAAQRLASETQMSLNSIIGG